MVGKIGERGNTTQRIQAFDANQGGAVNNVSLAMVACRSDGDQTDTRALRPPISAMIVYLNFAAAGSRQSVALTA